MKLKKIEKSGENLEVIEESLKAVANEMAEIE